MKPRLAEEYRGHGWIWTQEEEDYLRAHYHSKADLKACSEYLGRTQTAIYSKVQNMALYTYPKWSSTDVAFLRKNYGYMDPKDIAEHLGKTITQVYTKAKYLKLKSGTRWVRKK